MCTNFQTKQLWIFGPKFARKRILGSEFQNFFDLELASLRYYVQQFSGKTDNIEFLGPNFLKNGFWGRNFKNLSLDLQSAPPKYHVCYFSVKMDNF